MMNDLIQQELSNLEKQYDIKILYAVESGSRAWGFPSVNSDYDVRYIYLEQPEYYLSIDTHKPDTREYIEGDLDVSGWELRKALQLFCKSNPPLLEWLRSPIVYREEKDIMNQWRSFEQSYFNPKGCVYHYLSMAKGNFNDYLKRDRVKLKRYFYVLRPILSCKYIELYNHAPPIEFEKLVDFLYEKDVRDEVHRLLKIKKSSQELDEGPRIPILQDYLQQQIGYYTKYAEALDKNRLSDTMVLDRFFRDTLRKYHTI